MGVYGSRYRLQYPFNILKNFIVPKSHDKKSIRFKNSGSMLILKIIIMLTTIYFYNQPFFKTDKISDEIINRLLPSKFQTIELSAPEIAPKLFFRICRVITEIAGKFF